MKNLIFILFAFSFLHGQGSNEKITQSVIRDVTIFTQGAQVFRTADIAFDAGITDLVFDEISPFVLPASIQAGGKGNFIILEVKERQVFPEPAGEEASRQLKELEKKIKWLEDSISDKQFELDELKNRKDALLLEKDMILKNKLTRGEGKSDSLPVLKQAMEFFRNRLNDINTRLTENSRENKSLGEIIAGMKERKSQLESFRSNEPAVKKFGPKYQVVVTVRAENPVTGTVDINYAVNNAGWVPSYDLRSKGVSSPVEISWKAGVYQNTGEDWKNVRLKLSTGNMNRNNTKPVLPVWYLDYYRTKPAKKFTGSGLSIQADEPASESLKQMKDREEGLGPAGSAANYAAMIETMVNVEYDINLRYDIPADGSSHVVWIKKENLNADYIHYLVPRLESESYLLARITGWEGLNLLPGQANIFYDGTYVGQTVINPELMDDTLNLSMGRDRGLQVTRTRMPVKESSKFLGGEMVKTVTYELKVKNYKGATLNVIMEDQIPVAGNKEIKVDLKESARAACNDKTGLLTWNFSMNSKELKTLNVTYSVTSDQNIPLSMF